MVKSIAHIREEDDCVQTVEEHLVAVKRLAESYGKKIGVKHMAGLAGMLHDLGKYSEEFSSYILAAVYDPENAPRRGSVDHSTAGGKLLYDFFHNKKDANIYQRLLAEIIGNAIISHHSYLHDFLSPDIISPFLNRVHKDLPKFTQTKQMFFERVMTEETFYSYIGKATDELSESLKDVTPNELKFHIMFLTKYIFSCLIDADRTNTRQFVENEKPTSAMLKIKENQELFSNYFLKLKNKLNQFKQADQANAPINKLRSKMSDQCEKFAKKPSGIYTLSIPTGGGKTLASLRYALKHAQLFNKKRIVYVVPYTTIIEQNAEDIRNIIKDDMHLLEHHSNVIVDKSNEDEGIYTSEVNKKLMLAKDNWDSPIIFTTMVQFLNVFYTYGTRNIRRLHNLADSVIIFDEVQKVPTHCVSLFNRSLNFLSKSANSSIILCTATQPALDYVEHQLDIDPDAEIVADLPEVIDAFKRVEVIDKASSETFTNAKLIQFIFKQIEAKDSLLVILNTKSVVRDLFKQLENKKDEDTLLFHLSTSMCAAHRNDILDKVRHYLEDNKKIICISTQLIEAGVDISFDCVIRSLAGLDSIAQAAGRCNRHGEVGKREVYVIDHAEENLDRLKEIKTGKEITKKLLIDIKRNPNEHGGDILSTQAMNRYFKQFYTSFKNDLNYFIGDLSKNMSDLLGSTKVNNSYNTAYTRKWNKKLPLILTNSYQSAAKYFQVIDNNTTPVLVPYGCGKEYIALFNSYEEIDDLSSVLKKSQHYTVNVYDHELNELESNGQLESLMDGMILTIKEGAYSLTYGLEIEGDNPLSLSIF